MSRFNNNVFKSAEISIQELSEGELFKINKYALTPLSKEEIFTFKLSMCDNEIDDRNFEPFNLQSLKDMQMLYVGKTVLKDHTHSADSQVARIYDTELIYDDGKTTKANEPFVSLVAKCYMIKTPKTEPLIAEIKGGIKKEVSTACVPKKMLCSICGLDNTKTFCSHIHGKRYTMPNGKEKDCYFTIDGISDAIEVSFVAVPSQPRAGTTKEENRVTIDIERLSFQLKYFENYIFVERKEEKLYE